MKHPFLILKSYLLLFVLAIVCTPAWSQGITDQPFGDHGWASYKDMNQTTYQRRLTEMRRKGWRPVDVEVMGGNTRTYAAVFRQNKDRRLWELKTGLTSDQYNAKWREMKSKGFRPVDQESHLLRGKRYYGALWIKNKENYNWVSFRNLSSTDYGKRFQEYKNKGYMPVDVDAYKVGNEIRYSVIWVENKQRKQWAQYRNLTASQFGTRFQEMSKKGYRLLDTESYQNGRTQLYAAVWIKESIKWKANRDMTAADFSNKWGIYRDEGYRLEDIEVYSTPRGRRYAGVWIMNEDRYRWPKKNQVTQAVNVYRQGVNPAGMTVAVAEKGKIKYLKGFGYADLASGKLADGRTVYRLASVSKAITSVLTFQFQEEGKLKITDETEGHVDGLPDHHTHTIGDLLANRGRVRGYIDNDPVYRVNPNYNYPTAIAASGLFMHDPLLPQAGYVYSTHGYTLAATVLEKYGETSLPNVLYARLSDPNGLTSLRCENLKVRNQHRSSIYRMKDSGLGHIKLTPESLSWKYAGGGMESNAYDLVRLGMKLLKDKEILSTGSLNAMTTPPDNAASYAYGWDVGSHEGQRYFAKSGGQPGSRAYLICFPDKEVVVVVLCNTRVPNIPTLGRNIAGLLW